MSSGNQPTAAALLLCIILACLSLAGCGSSLTTPVGPLGAVIDVRSSLPPEVAQRFPTDAGATSHTTTQQVCKTPGKVEVRWRTAHDGDIAYILSYDVAVVEAVPNWTATLGQPQAPTLASIEIGAPQIYYVPVSIHCKRPTSNGPDEDTNTTIGLFGDGTWKVEGGS